MCSIGGEEEVDEVDGDTMEDTEERLLGYRNVEYRDGSLRMKSNTPFACFQCMLTCLNLMVV